MTEFLTEFHDYFTKQRIKMIDKALDSLLCMGCAACDAACPHDAIEMKMGGGKLSNHPVVNPQKCTSCEACLKVCAVLAHDKPNYDRPEAFAVWASDEIRASKSSSGGVFPVLAKYFLDTGGVVCGAAFVSSGGDLPRLEHIIITSADELPRLQGSKYIQSDTSSVLEPIKKSLRSGQKVLFVGLPCQVAGLKQYLKKDYEHLLTLDLICHGVPSYELWARYMKERFGDEHFVDVNFRDKINGWRGALTITTTTTTTTTRSADDDEYMTAFLKNLGINQACFSCKFCSFPRMGDITIGDFWGVANWDASLDDKKGTSLIFLNNQKGANVFESVKSEFKLVKQAPFEVACSSNLNLHRPSIPHQNYELFWRLLERGYSVARAVDICVKDKCDFAIYNFWWGMNYGANLTAYALQEAIWELGYIAKTIQLAFGGDWQKQFGAIFGKKYLYLTRPHDFESLELAQYDFGGLIFGSDQVIRPDFGGDLRNKMISLCLGLDQRRLMISASYGQNLKDFLNNKSSAKLRTFYNTAFASFDYISHREQSGVEITKKVFAQDAEFIIDPVFLIDRVKYEQIAQNNLTALPNDFIVAYILDDNDEYKPVFERLKKYFGVPCVLLKPQQNLSTETFLALFSKAKFILTDSFHGVCFSLIFNKNFFALRNQWRGDERFENLINIFNIDKNFAFGIKDFESKDIEQIDFERINNIIATHRATSLERLKTALDGRNTNESAKFGKIAMSAMVASNIQIAQK